MNKEIIIERYKHPKYFKEGLISNGKSLNSACGDEIYVNTQIDNGVVTSIEYCGTGCSICLATTDMLVDSIIGKKVDEVLKLDEKTPLEIIGMSGDSPRKRCGTLGFEAIKNSLIGVE